MILFLNFTEADLIVNSLSNSTDPHAPMIIQRIKDCEVLQLSQHRPDPARPKRKKGERKRDREKHKAAQRRYYQRHKDEIIAKARKRYAEMKDTSAFKDKRKLYSKQQYDKVTADPEKLEARANTFGNITSEEKSGRIIT